MIPQAIAIANGKGGVGKTTLAANVAGIAALSGWRTLLVELDPQANLNDDLGTFGREDYDEGVGLLTAVLTDGIPMVMSEVRPGLDLIPAGRKTQTLRDHFTLDPSSVIGLRNAVARVSDSYDLIIVDTPPATDRLVHAVFAMVHFIVLTTKGDKGSAQGLAHTGDIFADVLDAGLNPDLEVLGVVRFDFNPKHTMRLRNAVARIEGVLDGSPIPIFDTFIRTGNKTAEDCRDQGLLVHEYAERSAEAPAFWKALRDGTTPTTFGSNAEELATDYLNAWTNIRDVFLAKTRTAEEMTDVN